MNEKIDKDDKKVGGEDRQPLPHPTESRKSGKEHRDSVPHSAHGQYAQDAFNRDPIAILAESNRGRIEDLIPLRYGRMAQSPFSFYRGASVLMAADLALCPKTDITVQLCGDCHLLNFGVYATPERNIVFDINDFDETLPGPFEWDLKRLATSFVLTARADRFKTSVAREAAEAVVRSYRESMKSFAAMSFLDVWYARFDFSQFIAQSTNPVWKKTAKEQLKKATEKSSAAYLYSRHTTERDGRRVFKDEPPLVYHSAEQSGETFTSVLQEGIDEYKQSLQCDRQVLLGRYRITDVAMKVVGIGSVGTRCGIALLLGAGNDSLILQYKEARPSVLESYLPKSVYAQHARRVVEGQRLMQAASDIFLGWMTGPQGRHFYIRQLRDIKVTVKPEIWTPTQLIRAAQAMGWVLARAHARSGDIAHLCGYMGNKDDFDKAISTFALAYADQTEHDHQRLLQAIQKGEIAAHLER